MSPIVKTSGWPARLRLGATIPATTRCLVDSEAVGERSCADAGGGDDRPGVDLFPVGERGHGRRADLGDGRAEPDDGAVLGEDALGPAAETGVERRQERLACLDQGDLRLCEVNLWELLSQCVVVDLTEGTHDLHPGCAAADDHDVQRTCRHELGVRGDGLEAAEQMVADAGARRRASSSGRRARPLQRRA